jgi:hypothetical protein
MFQVNQDKEMQVAGSGRSQSNHLFSQNFTINDFPEFFMKSFSYFNSMAYGQSMHNQQIISNF